MEKRGAITFYNGDCMDIMKGLKDNYYDLAIVDPPYGADDAMNIKSTKSPTNSGIKANHYAKRTLFEQFENVEPPKEYWEQLYRVSKEQIIWGFNFMKNCHQTGGVLVWNKKGTAFGEAEVALCTMFKSVRIYELQWNGFLKHAGAEDVKRWHPTTKPRRLYEYCLLKLAPKDRPARILDTHGGSMSIARAVYDVNRMDGYGLALDVIELNKSYFDKGVKDFDEHTKNKTILF